MQSQRSHARWRGLPGACLGAFVLGTTAGALWMLPTLALLRPLPWLAIPVGWLLGVSMRRWIQPAGTFSAVLAALALLLAALYVAALTAAVKIAAMMGLGLIEALVRAGAPMLLALGLHGLAWSDLIWFALGAVCAALAARRG